MSIDTFLVYDIETAANDRAPAYYQGKKYDAPANYKDPEKIEKAILERRAKDMDDAALCWWTGRVTCASIIPLNGPSALVKASFYHASELELLLNLFDYISAAEAATGGRIIPVGKSSKIFDNPFLIGRAIAHDIGIPDALRGYATVRDVDDIFGFSSMSTQRSKLADYAWGMAIDGKLGDGAGAAALWLDVQMGLPGAWDRLVTYCERDTSITAEMLRRYLKQYLPRVLPVQPALEIPFA
jgi:hypothetical protein